MLGLHRASLPLRSRVLSIRVCSPIYAATEQFITQTLYDSYQSAANRCQSFNGFYRNNHAYANLSVVRRGFASRAGSNITDNSEDEDMDDAFSELNDDDNNIASRRVSSKVESEDELISEPEFSEDDDNVADAGLGEEVASKERRHSELAKTIEITHPLRIHEALDNWVKKGNIIDHEEINLVLLSLREQYLFAKALHFLEWLETSKTLIFSEKDHSYRLSLIHRVHGLEKAEKYFHKIPMSLRGESIYLTLLACYVYANNVKKAEEIFAKIKDDFTLTDFPCNRMIVLYKRTDQRKISDILSLMMENGIEPSLFTYSLLMDIRGQHGDIAGMERIIETVKASGLEPNEFMKFIAARHYCSAGRMEKVEAIAKEIEGDKPLEENRKVCHTLIHLYGELGKTEEVKRVWRACEAKPWRSQCNAAISAWGKLGKVEEAEAIFERMLKAAIKPLAVHFYGILSVYADNRMVEKGTALVKRMAEMGVKLDPSALDTLVRLYIGTGDLEKAELLLQRAVEQNVVKPLFASYVAIMENYSQRGDTHNTEKMFIQIKEAGYQPRFHQFLILIKAYVNSKTPLYGMHERMKVYNVSPSQKMLTQLKLVDPFK